jgi:hypothetical protein
MTIREWVARKLSPGLKSEDEVRDIVKEEIRQARAALPMTASYDPNNEGYRRAGAQSIKDRDLSPMSQDRMFEIAYFMFDNSAMTRRLAKMDKTFLFSEPITVTSDDDDVQEIIKRFWDDPENSMDMDLPDQIMWLGMLGEQLWPVEINAHNGHVTLGYIDPSMIDKVWVSSTNQKRLMRVDLVGGGARTGKKLAAIRKDNNPVSKTYGRLVGDCFFWRINNPPNAARGRSDFLTLFDWIDALERYGFNHLERAELMLNFVWDVLLKGMNEDEIREWLQNNPPPEPGSMRAHNEQVEWNAVSPELKSTDMTKGFDMGKSFIMGAAGRPDSWFGGGGKAYSKEADSMDQVPMKDLDERQLMVKNIVTFVVQFQIDQAVIARRLSEEKAEAGFEVNMPEISKKDFSKAIGNIPQATTAITLAEQNKWISTETATRLFAMVAGQAGMEIDAEKELEAAKNAPEPGSEDYED